MASAAASAAPSYAHPLAGSKLSYFPIAGRGETTRLLFAIGGIPFEDHRVTGASWGALKANTPWGSMPVLTLPDGQQIAQQRAIARFVAKHIGLYPASDFLTAARIDELLDAIEDLSKINDVGRGKPQPEKEADRLAAVTGPNGNIYQIFAKVEAYIANHGDGAGHAVGSALTLADVHLFAAASNIGSGFFDGVPCTCTDPFPNIQRVRKLVASLPNVQSWYARAEAAGRSEYARRIEANFAGAANL